jgi:hypothetical protein
MLELKISGLNTFNHENHGLFLVLKCLPYRNNTYCSYSNFHNGRSSSFSLELNSLGIGYKVYCLGVFFSSDSSL